MTTEADDGRMYHLSHLIVESRRRDLIASVRRPSKPQRPPLVARLTWRGRLIGERQLRM